MATDLIAAAKQKKAANDAAIEKLREENARLDVFLETAEALAAESSLGASRKRTSSVAASANGRGKVSVQQNTLVGSAAHLLMTQGPLALDDIVAGLVAAGIPNAPRLRNNINSAIWRRRKDLFERKRDGLYYLRTADVRFT